MDKEAHALREITDRGDLLVRPDDDLILEEKIRDFRTSERTVARLRLLWSHRQFLAKTLAVGLVISCVISFVIPPSFESIARLMPPDEQSAGLGMLAGLLGKAGGAESGGTGGLVSLAGSALGLKTSGDLFVGVLGSRTVEDDLIGKFDLRKLYGVGTWERAREKLRDHTDISIDRKSGIISVQVADRSPQRAAAMAQEYVAALNYVVANENTSSARRERVFLEGRLSQVKRDLESAERNFSQFASDNGAINVPEQGRAMIAATAELDGQLIATQTQLESLKQIYTDNNVRVREAQARVDELQRQLNRIGGAPSAKNTADPQETGAVYPSIRQLPRLGVDYADLYRQTKVEEAVFEGLTQEYELAKVQEAKETPSVNVLDPANEPEKPVLSRPLVSSLGTLLVGVLGIAWVFARDKWQRVDPQDPRKALALEVFGSVRSHLPSHSSNGASGKTSRPGLREPFVKRQAGSAELFDKEDRK